MRILLAEDDEVLADGLSRALRETGCREGEAGEGEAGDESLSGQALHVCLPGLMSKTYGRAAVFLVRPAARSAAAINPSTVRSCGRISACASLRAG